MPTGTVITADIVNSTNLAKPLLSGLFRTIRLLGSPHKLEFYRGDSFQLYVKNNGEALELALLLRLAARRISPAMGPEIDIRTAIGIGNVKSPVRVMKTSGEEPFILSGRALDELASSNDRLRIVCSNETATDICRVIARFIDYIFHDLTSKQAEVVYELLAGYNQVRTAKKLRKAQATINRQAHAAGWPEIERMISEYKQAITKYQLS